jgi:hypothetical protein
MQHRLYFLPLPQGQGALRFTFSLGMCSILLCGLFSVYLIRDWAASPGFPTGLDAARDKVGDF